MTLTKLEAERALYVDFEGNTDMAPTLLGVLYRVDAPDGGAGPRSWSSGSWSRRLQAQ